MIDWNYRQINLPWLPIVRPICIASQIPVRVKTLMKSNFLKEIYILGFAKIMPPPDDNPYNHNFNILWKKHQCFCIDRCNILHQGVIYAVIFIDLKMKEPNASPIITELLNFKIDRSQYLKWMGFTNLLADLFYGISEFPRLQRDPIKPSIFFIWPLSKRRCPLYLPNRQSKSGASIVNRGKWPALRTDHHYPTKPPGMNAQYIA